MTLFVDTPQSVCRFALAVGDITPPVGIYHRMWGAASHDRAEGVHRPLRATVAIFQAAAGDFLAGNVQVVAALDHCLMHAPEVAALQQAVGEAIGLSPDAVMVIFSHTHAAGLMTRDRVPLPGGELIPDYLEQINRTAADLAVEAKNNLQPATLIYTSGQCNLAAHRDFRDEASGQWVCGFHPPELPCDETLLTVRAVDESGRTIATMVNYACHPTTLAWDNRLISPDYPGALRETVEQATGAPCLFIQGASGDLGPREGYVGDVETADRNGRQAGYAALAALESISPAAAGRRFSYTGPVVSGATLGAWSYEPLPAERRTETAAWNISREEMSLPYRDSLPTAEQTLQEKTRWEQEEHEANERGDSEQAAKCRAMAERETRMAARLEALPAGTTYPYRVAMWRIGDAVWLGAQGEPYSVLQTELREKFPQRAIVVAAIADGWGPSYMPTAAMYDTGVYQESIAVLAAGCLETLIEKAAERIEKLFSPA